MKNYIYIIIFIYFFILITRHYLNLYAASTAALYVFLFDLIYTSTEAGLTPRRYQPSIYICQNLRGLQVSMVCLWQSNEILSFRYPPISDATRITKNSSTLIDNIFCNLGHNFKTDVYILNTAIIDHHAQVLSKDSASNTKKRAVRIALF